MSVRRTLQLLLIVVMLFSTLAFTRGASAAEDCGSSYVVQPGDWLAKIASRCGVSLTALYAANPWTRYQRYIYTGQVLVIPGDVGQGQVISSYPVPMPIPGGYWYGYCGPAYSAQTGSYYVVCRGDTLARIARYYGVSVAYLVARNNIANAHWIYAGQVIYP
jgi:LysM repeat protein